LADCLVRNPHNVLSGRCTPAQRIDLRAAYARCLARETVEIVAPSRSFHARYAELFPVLREKPWHFIPHGIDADVFSAARGGHALPRAQARRLRVVVPGRLLLHKGGELLQAMADELSAFADVLLLGAGEGGKAFAGIPNVRVVDSYEREELVSHVESFEADAALLPSIVAESFSYTLSEMWALGLPVVATRLGAFEERIQDGETGLLADCEAGAILACLRRLAEERDLLVRMTENVKAMPVRTVEAMVRDYEALLFRHRPDREGDGIDGITGALWQTLRDQAERQAVDASVQALERELAGQRALVAAMHASTSWRITRPLRLLKQYVAAMMSGKQ
jgi:glycosyltransferase involved in cell wall biosynthesis